jgi:GT2 family glycosyltransferase
MTGHDIIFIVNSFNRAALLKEALDALHSWLPASELAGRVAVVVFEAGSSDGSIELLEQMQAGGKIELSVVRPKAGEPASFAAGANAAAGAARQSFPKAKYFVLYETDNVLLSAEPLGAALRLLEGRAELAACGFTVRKHDGTPAGIAMPFPKLIHFLAGPELTHHFRWDANRFVWEECDGISWSYCDIVFTSPCVVKCAAWDTSRGFDAEAFPFSDCDLDWAKRLRSRGWRMAVIRSTEVIHDNRETLSTWSLTRAKNLHRARLTYFRRHLGRWVIVALPILAVRHALELSFLLVSRPWDRALMRTLQKRWRLLRSIPAAYR